MYLIAEKNGKGIFEIWDYGNEPHWFSEKEAKEIFEAVATLNGQENVMLLREVNSI